LLRLTGLLCFVLAAPAFAGSGLFQGTFTEDDQVALIPFTLSSDSSVLFQSYGYAGGTAPGGISVSAGGFDPIAILFDSTGAEIGSDNGGHCGTTGTDPVTLNCSDPYVIESLTTGSYTLAFAVWDNVPNRALSDGFRQDGNPGFTCAEFSLSGQFCDTGTALGVARTGDYAVAISGEGVEFPAAVPEPSTLALSLVFVIPAILKIRRRHERSARRS
jgi:hypothetical protein